MEINITHLMAENTHQWSDSIAHSGLNDIGKRTWDAAKASAKNCQLCSDKGALVAYFDAFGAWDDLDQWKLDDLNALLLQFISGDINEAKELCPDGAGGIDWDEYRELSEAGQAAGNLFREGGSVYFLMSH